MRRRSVRIRPVLPPGTSILALLGDGPAKVDPGGGGWVPVERPKRVSATDWRGLVPNGMAVPMLFDGFAEDRSIERQISALSLLMRTPTKQTGRPAVVRLESAAVPHTNIRWVINGIDWGDEERRSDGQRTRAFFTLNLLQYIPVEILVEEKASPAQQAQERAEASSSTRVYAVKQGDTLSAIAGQLLGNRNRWPEIAKLNDLRDPNRIQVGQQLRIP